MIWRIVLALGLFWSLPAWPGEVSDQQVCATLLSGRFNEALLKSLQNIVWDSEQVEQAIALMKQNGEIRNQTDEDRLRAQLQLGAMFINEGLLHEAVYLVFKGRYGSKTEMADAIHGFKNLSDAENMEILLREIMERALQFIPDVDVDNVNQIREVSAYLNLNEDQLTSFRNKWLVFDQMDSFVEILQGGIYAILTAPTDAFIESVLSRGGMRYKWSRLRNGIKLPSRPVVQDGIKQKAVVVKGENHFLDADLERYLSESSSAARRFFILDKMHFFSVEQLRWTVANAGDLFLKQSIVVKLTKELSWRLALKEKVAKTVGIQQDLNEAQFSIDRLTSQEPYDLALFQKRINALRVLEDPKQIAIEVLQILQDYRNKVDSSKFINLVSSLINSIAARLKKDRDEASQIIVEIVNTANLIGLKEEHALKLKKMLLDFSATVGNLADRTDDYLRALLIRTPKYFDLSLEALQRRKAELNTSLQAAESDIETTYSQFLDPTFPPDDRSASAPPPESP